MRTKRLIVMIGIVVATTMLMAGCGSDDSTDASEKPEGPTSSAPTSPAATSEPAGTSDLEGTWQAGPLSLKDTEATIRRYGLGRYVGDYRENSPFFGDDTVLTLTIENGAWDLYGISGGGEPVPIDYNAEYEIDGESVVFHHSDGSNFYRWQVGEDTLTLHFVKSTLPGYRGIPDEVFQRALYMTEVFTRQD